MDEADEDEDEQLTVQDVPFIAEEDFLMKHGSAFSLTFNDNKEVVLAALHS